MMCSFPRRFGSMAMCSRCLIYAFSYFTLVILSLVTAEPVVNMTSPPLGFMSWERFRCTTNCAMYPNDCIDESLYMSIADALVDGGYAAAGYVQVSIDDCWSAGRNTQTGELLPDPDRFPNGMKALAEYLHSKGLKFGIYSDVGSKTCARYAGSEGYEDLDAATFAYWGVDYLKLDGCNINREMFEEGYTKFGEALKKAATIRPIGYSCSWPAYLGDNESTKPFDNMYKKAGCNTWRNWHDIDNNWKSLQSIILHWARHWRVLGQIPHGSFNDADMLLVGDDHNGHTLSLNQARLQQSFWAMIASPLFIGGDARKIEKPYREILLNKDIIAINQDGGGHQADCIVGCPKDPTSDSVKHQQVWSKELSGGMHSFGFFNLDDVAYKNITVSYYAGKNSVIRRCVDLWAESKNNVCPSDNDSLLNKSHRIDDWRFERAIFENGDYLLRITATDMSPMTQRMLRIELAEHESQRLRKQNSQ